MGAVVRPFIVAFESCATCGSVVWRCRLQRGGTVPIDPRPAVGRGYDVMSDGRLRDGLPEPLVARYQHHTVVCSVGRLRSAERLLREVLDREVAEAVAEGRVPPPPGRLALLGTDPPRGWPRPREGWVDLTSGEFRQPPAKRWNGVVVVDIVGPRERPRPN